MALALSSKLVESVQKYDLDVLHVHYAIPHAYAAYMAKQMQALSRAGIVSGGRGRNGFYVLAKPPQEITLLDILLAVDGDKPMFSCAEIRQNGPCGSPPEECKSMCGIAIEFAKAEKLYRTSLAQVDLKSMNARVVTGLGADTLRKTANWLAENNRKQG